MTLDDLKTLLILTLRQPDQAVARLIGLNLPVPLRWMALAVAVSLSAILAYVATLIFGLPQDGDIPMVSISSQPLILAISQGFAIVIGGGLMAGVGRLFGGRGNFADALLLTTWIEFVLMLLQAVQIVLSLLLPPVAGILGIVSIVLFLWMTVQFTKALHGFRSGFLVLLTMFLTLIVVGFVLSILLSAMGVMPEMSI